MKSDTEGERDSQSGAGRSREWVHHVIALLDSALVQLHERESVAQFTMLEAASLLKKQIPPGMTAALPGGPGRLLTWQVRKVCAYIDANIANRLLVADLCALVRLSEAHFARSFRLTFGEPPHAFVVRRRLELASRYMVQNEMSLSEIAQLCGFADQAHLCRRFRDATGQSPAAWRRALRR
jgi:AraC-like DNA-binding protein